VDNTFVTLKNVSVHLRKNTVLENVNLNIQEGEFVSILGKSGVGKTTLLNTIAKFISHKGHIHAPTSVGVVFQNYSIFPWMNVKKNIEFGLDHLTPEKRRRITEYYLLLTELKKHSHKYSSQLSGGQMQRVALARAFAPQPELLLMDEPFGSLDVFTREKMQQWLWKLWQQDKKTILFVTHSVEEAIFLSTRIIILKDGQIARDIRVDLPTPREEHLKYTKKFLDLRKKIVSELSYN
jgi:NitT/TauT family transport system ATP-binding protein